MKHKKLNKSHRVKQVKIAFTNKPITAWGGIGSLIAQFLERIEFREWTESSIPIKETSNNSGGIYEKVLSFNSGYQAPLGNQSGHIQYPYGSAIRPYEFEEWEYISAIPPGNPIP
ncbi:MAG: hypothetical protein J7K40_12910 [candidate division Zixibacteria bacterium]|nr:hypothetical protein [candidate division Zixibacteria bacterium]